MATVTISIPDSLKTFIESQVEAKGFGNVSEYLNSLVLEEQHRNEEAQLEGLLLEALNSSEGEMELNQQFWDELDAEATQMITAHRERTRNR